MTAGYFIKKVRGYVFLAWIAFIMSFLTTLVMAEAGIGGKNVVFGVGFLAIGIVGGVSKVLISLAKGYPIPFFGFIASLCPTFIGYTMVMRMEEFFNIRPMGLIFIMWVFLSIVQLVQTTIYEDEYKKEIKQRRREEGW